MSFSSGQRGDWGGSPRQIRDKENRRPSTQVRPTSSPFNFDKRLHDESFSQGNLREPHAGKTPTSSKKRPGKSLVVPRGKQDAGFDVSTIYRDGDSNGDDIASERLTPLGRSKTHRLRNEGKGSVGNVRRKSALLALRPNIVANEARQLRRLPTVHETDELEPEETTTPTDMDLDDMIDRASVIVQVPEVTSPASEPSSRLPVHTGTRSAATPPLKVSRTILRTYGRQEGPPLAVDEFDQVAMDLEPGDVRSRALTVYSSGKKVSRHPVMDTPLSACRMLIRANARPLSPTCATDSLYLVAETDGHGKMWMRDSTQNV